MLKLILIALISFGFMQEATAKGKALPTKKITVKIGESGSLDAVKMLLDKTSLKAQIPKSLDNSKKVSIAAKNTPWNEVFQMVLDNAGYTYSFDSRGVLQLKPTDEEGTAARVPAKASEPIPEPE